MGRTYLKQLGERQAVKEVFLVGDKQLRKNRNDNLYLQMRLSDRTGAVNAMMWNVNDRTAATFKNGDYVQIEGTAQVYNGAMQIIVTRIEAADPTQIDDTDFLQLNSVQVEEMMSELGLLLRSLNDPSLRQLGECFLEDEPLMQRFSRAPAAVKNHHAFHGGLLQHVVQLMQLSRLVGDHYEQLDSDQLIFGAFLHDIGKVEELTYQPDLGYSDAGQLLGHLVLGVGILEDQIKRYEAKVGKPFPQELGLRLKHMIVSHHGRLDFGSPKVPMTLEAIALHFLDDLDAKIYNFNDLMEQDANTDSPWTPYHAGLGRKLFKGVASATPDNPTDSNTDRDSSTASAP